MTNQQKTNGSEAAYYKNIGVSLMNDIFEKVLEIVTDYDFGEVMEVSNSKNEYLLEATAIYNFVKSNSKVHEVTTDMLADNIDKIVV